MQKEPDRSEHQRKGECGKTEWRTNSAREAVKPDEATRHEIEGEHMQPDRKAPLRSCERR
jgi:hypothetical protein